MLKTNDYSVKSIETILKYYETNNPLSQMDIEVLKIDLMFPHWFFGLIKTMHKNPKPISSDKISTIANFEQNKFSALQKWI